MIQQQQIDEKVLDGSGAPPASPPIRVFCVDDNEMLAGSVERRIAFESRFKWVGWTSETHNLDSLVTTVAATEPDVVLVDVDMPGVDAFELVRHLATKCPQARSVIFSGYVHKDLIDQAVEAGAWGYISKVGNIDEVLDALEQVAQGEFVLSQDAVKEQRRP